MWRQALGPLAEWIANTFWSTTSGPLHAKPPATRLTQNRKREAKGILRQLPSESRVIQRTPVEKSFSHEVRIIPKLARLDRFDPVAQSRRADSQRRQAAAQRAWNPNEKPDWLDEKAYRARVQPNLARIVVSRIMSALSISEPYALRIRGGRCIPHPRHWHNLATLVGILSA